MSESSPDNRQKNSSSNLAIWCYFLTLITGIGTIGMFLVTLIYADLAYRELLMLLCFVVGFIASSIVYYCERKKLFLGLALFFIVIYMAYLFAFGAPLVKPDDISKDELSGQQQTQEEYKEPTDDQYILIADTTYTSTSIPFETPGFSYSLGWVTRETKKLYPMHVVVGDIEIEGKKYYDEGGTGQCTIAVNFSPSTVAVFAQWGAGEYELSYEYDYALLQLENIIQDQFNTSSHHNQVRLVTIDKNGQISQKYINKLN